MKATGGLHGGGPSRQAQWQSRRVSSEWEFTLQSEWDGDVGRSVGWAIGPWGCHAAQLIGRVGCALTMRVG